MKYILVRVDEPREDGDTGGDFEEIANLLKDMKICAACVFESQEHSCSALEARRLGRRLWRLIERAKARRLGRA